MRQWLRQLIWAQWLASVIGGVLEIRKMYDPFIICLGAVPGSAAEWPRGLTTKNYDNALDLCSAAFGKGQNLGCICTVSRGTLDCDSSATNTALADSYVEHDFTFLDYCKDVCYCSTQKRAESVQITTGTHWWENTAFGSIGDPLVASSSEEDTQQAPQPPQTQQNIANKCGASNCSTHTDCSTSHEADSCKCMTTSSTYNPGVGTTAFLAACLVSVGGKRDVSPPCPCNASYVSFACCNTRDGFVWEDDQYKLGSLLASSALEL